MIEELQTFDELADSEELCNYCRATDYGANKTRHTPTSYYMCEGQWCKEAYDEYLDENNVTENIVKYIKCLKLIKESD